MLDRDRLVLQMAKAFVGEEMMDPLPPAREARDGAEEALARVERYLGADIEQAKEIINKVLEDVG